MTSTGTPSTSKPIKATKAENVTINGCTVVDAQSLAAIMGNASSCGPITIENCNMRTVDGGTAIYVKWMTEMKVTDL